MKAAIVRGLGVMQFDAEDDMVRKFNEWVDKHPHCDVVKVVSPLRHAGTDMTWKTVHWSVLTFFYIEGNPPGDILTPTGGMSYTLPRTGPYR